MSRHSWAYLVLAFGVLLVSSASVLIRFAQQGGVSSLGIACARLALAALIVTPIAWVRVGDELRVLQRRDLLLALGAGCFLALHFAAWVSSLGYTSVASSAALVATNPLWIGLASVLLLREPLRAGVAAGIGLTLLGSGCIIVSDSTAVAATGSNPLLGNLLALVGAIAVSGYFLIGRSLRQRVSLLTYIWLVYSAAALVLILALVLSNQTLLGLAPSAYVLLFALAIGPQLLGHTAFNWALGYLSATLIAITILAEPIGAAALAWLLFDEGFAPLQLLGFALLLLGIFVAARAEAPVAENPAANQ
jgi:drug/metabolite transporter (DMT)-like permease